MRIVVTGTQERLGRLLLEEVRARGNDAVDVPGSDTAGYEARFDGAEVVLCAMGSDLEKGQMFTAQEVAVTAAAAQNAGVRRFIRVSANGAHDPGRAARERQPFLAAHLECEAYVRESGLDWTVVRPATMTDSPGTGCVHLQIYPGSEGHIPRADVAGVVLALLDEPHTVAMVMEVRSGTDPIDRALAGAHNVPPFLG